MKHLKKLGSVLLALVMVMALAAPAFAASTGSITVQNATIGATYNVYKIFDAEYSEQTDASGNPKEVIYTIAAGDPWYDLVSDADSPFDLKASTDGSKYYVTQKTTFSDAQVIAWLQSQTLPNASADPITATSATVTFTGLDLGYYLVKSTVNGGGVITLTNANPRATVKDKNEVAGDFSKTIIGGTEEDSYDEDDDVKWDTAQIGDTIQYKLSFKATDFGTNGKEDDEEKNDTKITDYVLADTLPEGIVLDQDSIVVKVGETTLDLDDNQYFLFKDTTGFKVVIPWVENLSDYVTISENYKGTTKWEIDGTSQPFSSLTEDERKELYLKEFIHSMPENAASIPVTVTYSGKLVADAVVDGTEGNVNKAEWAYDGVNVYGSEREPGKEHEEKTVYTYALAIKKVNVDGEPLEGAEFTLTDSEGNLLKVSQVMNPAEDGEEATAKAGYYIVDENGTATITSPASGVIVIQGVSGETYTLTETKAPEGYNVLDGGVDIEATLLGSETTDTEIILDANGNKVSEESSTTTTVNVTLDDVAATAVAVMNRAGTQLPETGGIGTTIFYVVGGVLVVGAVVLLIAKRRTSVDDE